FFSSSITICSIGKPVRANSFFVTVEAQGHKNERTNNEMPETDIEFDEIELSPTEFDALATVTKKLLARTGLPIEQIVMDEL
ncbi:phage major capsid family protein, partial [Escherichia sp. HC-CC]